MLKYFCLIATLIATGLFFTGSCTTSPPATVTKGIWIGPDEIAKLPKSGGAWKRLYAAAHKDWRSASFTNKITQHDVNTLAGALVAARTGDSAMRTKTIAGLHSAMNAPAMRTLELARSLQTYIISADIIGYHDPAFEQWVKKMLTIRIPGHSGGQGIVETAERSSNNWGAHARASAIAGALYLGDSELLQRMVTAYKAFIGLPAPGNHLRFTPTNWHAGSPKAGVNVRGATISGIDVSGVLPEEWRRGGAFLWPPTFTGYMWEGMQGFVVSAALLHRAKEVSFNAGDNAVTRAAEILYRIDNPAKKDDTWIPWVINAYGGTHLPVTSARAGKGMAWTDWTLAK